MRTISLLPLTALMAVAVGCGPDTKKQPARSTSERDLTLAPQTAEVKIASPMETQRPRMQQPTRNLSQSIARRAPAPRSYTVEPKVKLADVWVPAPALAAPQPAAQPASSMSTPANGRELLPGKTVTVIPASSGPSTEPDRTDELPARERRTMVARGGGTCRGRGRGPGIGIAGAPRPDFR